MFEIKIPVIGVCLLFLPFSCNPPVAESGERTLGQKEMTIGDYFYNLGRSPIACIGSSAKVRLCMGKEYDSSCLLLLVDIVERSHYVFTEYKDDKAILKRGNIDFEKSEMFFDAIYGQFETRDSNIIIYSSRERTPNLLWHPRYEGTLEICDLHNYWVLYFATDNLEELPKEVESFNDMLPADIPNVMNNQ